MSKCLWFEEGYFILAWVCQRMAVVFVSQGSYGAKSLVSRCERFHNQ